MDYAVIRTGGKQYIAHPGELLEVELVDTPVGEEILIKDVLLTRIGDEVKIGTPTIPGAVVRAKVVSEKRAPKVVAFKKRRRKGFRKLIGHRQDLNVLLIKDIS